MRKFYFEEFWDQKVRREILLDCKHNNHGNGERNNDQWVEVCKRLVIYIEKVEFEEVIENHHYYS